MMSMGYGGKRADARGAALSVRLGAGMALLVFGGYLLDRALGTLPAFLLVGSLLGAVVVMYDLMRSARSSAGRGEKKSG